jgi:hypothetical protein
VEVGTERPELFGDDQGNFGNFDGVNAGCDGVIDVLVAGKIDHDGNGRDILKEDLFARPAVGFFLTKVDGHSDTEIRCFILGDFFQFDVPYLQ